MSGYSENRPKVVGTVHYLYPPPTDVGHFIRIGHTGHRMLENLLAARKSPIRRAVIDASHASEQVDLIEILRNEDVELVLDTKSAELASEGGYMTKARWLPWAQTDRMHRRSDFIGNALSQRCRRIAEFAVATRVDAVLAPTHLISELSDPWLPVDAAACAALRIALDETGGQAVQIDYPLVITYSCYCDPLARNAVINALDELPFSHLWLRVASFGMSSSPAAVVRYIRGAWEFHTLGKPVIADGVGGLVGLSLASFGAVGGICHGIAEKENFHVSHWKKPRSSKGGVRRRVYLPDVDMYVSTDQARSLFQGHGAKALLGCNDTSCCLNGLQDMIETPKTHALIQSERLVATLNEIPDANRMDFFINKRLKTAIRTARKAEKLKLSEYGLERKIKARSRRLELLDEALEHLRDSQPLRYPKEPDKRRAHFRQLFKPSRLTP